MENKFWVKLDNAGKIYPAARSRRWMQMFRISVTLNEDIDTELLALAQKRTLKRLPTFSCSLKKGLFWYYLDHSEKTSSPEEDVKNPMVRMKLSKDNPFLFRIRYYNKHVAIEVFHVLTDGKGALIFLMTMIREYLQLRYGENIPTNSFILSCDDTPTKDELADKFLEIARKATLSRKEKPAYHVKGTPVEKHWLSIINGTIPTDKLAAKAKEYGVSISIFIASLMILSIQEIQQKDHSPRKRKTTIKISIPVDLRNIYKTNTIRNFSSYVNIGINSALGRFSFEEILVHMKHAAGMEITEKNLNAKVSQNVSTERSIFIRPIPLVIKTKIMKMIFNMQGTRYNSSTLSNLGVIKLPEEMEKYITHIDCQGGAPNRNSSICACISYLGETTISFSSVIKETEFERFFFTSLIKMGIPVKIESNRR